MKSKILIRYVICFVFFLLCNVVVYAGEKNNLDKAVFHFDVSSAGLTIQEQDTIKRMAQKISCLKYDLSELQMSENLHFSIDL